MLGPTICAELGKLLHWLHGVPALIKLELAHDFNHVIVLNIQLINKVSRNVAWIAEAGMAGFDFPSVPPSYFGPSRLQRTSA